MRRRDLTPKETALGDRIAEQLGEAVDGAVAEVVAAREHFDKPFVRALKYALESVRRRSACRGDDDVGDAIRWELDRRAEFKNKTGQARPRLVGGL